MSRTQTINAQTYTQRENKIYEVWHDAYVPGAEKRDLLMIYIRYKRITIDSLKNSHQKLTFSKNSYILYL